ncbi:hypothetical protein OC846_002738 [Tilletia horrida]|uniref:Nickel/cobalt efflux system n=1 Tax=Tilletia horrida TaxID=155126 RepID=A0AAN6GRE1_9BASI|nr:hypothetical protein OC846_002738 [Tilletia horrida]
MTDTDRSPGRDPQLAGCLTRIILPLLRAVKRPYHLYPIGESPILVVQSCAVRGITPDSHTDSHASIGVLFGLGFDTASTITLLSVAAIAQRNPDDVGNSVGSSRGDGRVILLALLFTGGMSLVDSCDSVLMVIAYSRLGRRRDAQSLQSLDEKEHRKLAGKQGVEVGQEKVEEAQSHPNQQSTTVAPAQNDKLAPVDLEESPSTIADQQQAPESPRSPRPLEIATGISFYLTLLSVLLAFAICIIEVFGIVASQCSSCAAAASVEPASNRSLNGRWWAFWAAASDQLGYIGAGIVGVFLLLSVSWWLGRLLWRRHSTKTSGQAQETIKSKASKWRVLREILAKRPRLRRAKPHHGLTLFGGSLLLIGCEILANVLIWTITAVVFVTSHRRADLALAVLAWTTGLRHGLDADHISAIDNSIRRFLALKREEAADAKQDLGAGVVPQLPISGDNADNEEEPAATPLQHASWRKRIVRNLNAPVLTGLYFSLGHSSIVIVATAIVAASTSALSGLQAFGDGPGGYVGTIVSATFLGLVGLLNSILLGRAWVARRRLRKQVRSST